MVSVMCCTSTLRVNEWVGPGSVGHCRRRGPRFKRKSARSRTHNARCGRIPPAPREKKSRPTACPQEFHRTSTRFQQVGESGGPTTNPRQACRSSDTPRAPMPHTRYSRPSAPAGHERVIPCGQYRASVSDDHTIADMVTPTSGRCSRTRPNAVGFESLGSEVWLWRVTPGAAAPSLDGIFIQERTQAALSGAPERR